MTWKYLHSRPFYIRHLLAAHYLKNYQHIIELGGFSNPIARAVEHDFKQIVSVDPLTAPLREEKVIHINEDYRLVDFSPWMQHPYALVMLGMDLPFDLNLVYLCCHAECILIEFPPAHAPSLTLFEKLRTFLPHTIELQVGLDLTGNDFGDLTASFPVLPHRKFYVLQKVTATSQTTSSDEMK